MGKKPKKLGISESAGNNIILPRILRIINLFFHTTLKFNNKSFQELIAEMLAANVFFIL